MSDTTKAGLSRRSILTAGAAAGAGLGLGAASHAHGSPVVTPPHTEGPFYPVTPQDDRDADLTRIEGREGRAKGEVITVEGRVLDEDGTPLADAVVDIWQANAAGRYAHERDPNPAPLDPDFQGWAVLTTDAQGRYRFTTVRPGAYPVSKAWTRPPHIHFKVSKRGHREITTQMYFEGEALNARDRLLNEWPEDQQQALIAVRESEDAPYRFDVVLAKV